MRVQCRSCVLFFLSDHSWCFPSMIRVYICSHFVSLGGCYCSLTLGQNFTPLLREKLESHKAGYDQFISLKKHFTKRWIHFTICYRQQHNPHSAQSSRNLPRAGALVISISMFFLTRSTRGIEWLCLCAVAERAQHNAACEQTCNTSRQRQHTHNTVCISKYCKCWKHKQIDSGGM